MKFYFKIMALAGMVLHSTLCQAALSDNLNQYLDRYDRHIGINGNVLVAKQDQVMLLRSFGYQDWDQKIKNKAETQFEIGSITKQMTAVAILQLIEQGKLSLNDPLSKILPQWTSPWASQATVYQLLNHTSGIYDLTPLEMKTAIDQKWSAAFLIDFLRDKQPLTPPGLRHHYSNVGYVVLGQIIAKISQMPLEEYFRTRLFQPLHMLHTRLPSQGTSAELQKTAPHQTLAGAYVKENAELPKHLEGLDLKIANAAGGVISTIHDLHRWNQGLYNGRLLSKESLAILLTPGMNGYGCGIAIEHLNNGKQVYYHGGSIDGYQSVLAYLPEQQMTLVVLTNLQYPEPHRMESLMNHMALLALESEKGSAQGVY